MTRVRTGAALALSALIAGGAEGQAPVRDGAGAGDRVLQSFARCRAVTAPDARLACFDAAASALETAVRSKDVQIVDRQDVRTARRSLFGFTLPRIDLFGGRSEADAKDAFQELNTTVASARTVANNRVELRLAEGDALWVTTDPLAFAPRAGTKVRIRKGALGNYFINLDGERSVRGTRLR